MRPDGEKDASLDEIVKPIPANLYDGISADAEDVLQARIDREQGLLTRLRRTAMEAEARGDFEAAEKLKRGAISLRRYFLRSGG